MLVIPINWIAGADYSEEILFLSQTFIFRHSKPTSLPNRQASKTIQTCAS